MTGPPEQILLDVWGVLHDGAVPFDDALRFVGRVAAERIPLTLLTNASWSGSQVQDHLGTLGFPRLEVLTAGDFARSLLLESGAGSVCFVGNRSSAGLVEGVPLVEVESADLVVLADLVPGAEQALGVALQRGIPVLCANPDRYIEDRFGRRTPKAGALAWTHRERGGDVWFAGKPDPAIFARARRAAGAVFIGDSPSTDLAGARAAGIPAIWLCRRPLADEDTVRQRYAPVRQIRSLDEIHYSKTTLNPG